jgi:hypothetical protein
MAVPIWLELSALGGLLQTRTTYDGASSDALEGLISSGSSPSFGLELMRMRQHWGIGFGVHFNSYTEQLRADEQYGSFDEIFYTHTLHPVDTTILTVIDTVVVDGATYYVTGSMNTTIWILDTEADTTTTTIVTREALERTNKVSYVEIPLLFDLHTSGSKWRFGLRAGPTLGLMTSRQGSLPIGPGGSFVSLEDQPLKTTTLGYVARPYVRYLIGDAWSFGLEPCIRGQLLDTDASDDLDRRSMGVGLMLGIGYRL